MKFFFFCIIFISVIKLFFPLQNEYISNFNYAQKKINIYNSNNVPMNITECQKYLNESEIILTALDFAEVLHSDIPQNTFVYLDPPYYPVSATANFTGYSKGGFTREDQIRLRECCDYLTKNKIKFMLSNSDTEFIREQYSAYNITRVQAKRSINSVGDRRGNVNEVVVRNYG